MDPQGDGNEVPARRQKSLPGIAKRTSKDARIRHPRMYRSAIQASGKRTSKRCANPPSMQARTRQAWMADPATLIQRIQQRLLQRLQQRLLQPQDRHQRGRLPPWMVLWMFLTGMCRNGFWRNLPGCWGLAARPMTPTGGLMALSLYPDHVIAEAFDAARQWLRKPGNNHRQPGPLAGRHGKTQARSRTESRQHGDRSRLRYGGVRWAAVRSAGGRERPAARRGRQTSQPEDRLWSTVLQELSLQLPDGVYDRWVRDTRLLSAAQDEYVVGLANPQAKDWLENRLANTSAHVSQYGRLSGERQISGALACACIEVAANDRESGVDRRGRLFASKPVSTIVHQGYDQLASVYSQFERGRGRQDDQQVPLVDLDKQSHCRIERTRVPPFGASQDGGEV